MRTRRFIAAAACSIIASVPALAPAAVQIQPSAQDKQFVAEAASGGVLDAATHILAEEGHEGFTVDAVVARSGVAKTTIYRHWPTKIDLLIDAFQEPAIDRLVGQGPVEQGLGVPLDRGQRCLELMRCIGHEILPHSLEPAQVGNIVKDQHRARWGLTRQGRSPH